MNCVGACDGRPLQAPIFFCEWMEWVSIIEVGVGELSEGAEFVVFTGSAVF